MASRLLPEVFAGFEAGDPITVLDLGPGNADTLGFLSRYRARVFFADLLENPILRSPPEDIEAAELTDILAQQLAVPVGTRLNVCLLWDYLHYLDLQQIELLSSIIRPLLAKGARGYGFGTLHGKPPNDANQYGIADIETLAAHPAASDYRYLAHSQQRLSEHFSALQIARGTLLREGRLELLLEGV